MTTMENTLLSSTYKYGSIKIKMTTEIKLTDLNIGHYVVNIVEQAGEFTLSAPAHIKSIKTIKSLKNKGVISVLIDESKTLGNSIPASLKSKKAEELLHAKAIFTESKNIQKDIYSKALLGAAIDLTPVVDVTNKSVDAIFNNPDSLACMVNIREKDEYLLEHSVAVSIYITIFAHYLQFDKKIIQELSVGAFLHDIGKIKIPEKVLNKPGKLTDEEFTVMKTHVNHSIAIIEKTEGISELSLEIAAQHHEKLNGKGYPFGLSGNKISQYGRMIAICDIFDALTATRVYKKGFTHPKAFSILRELGKQEHLDTQLVDQFIRCIGVFPIGSLVQLESNKIAIVDQRNSDDPTNPKVRAFYSVKLNQYENTQYIDLTDTDDFIVKGVRAEEFNINMDTIVEMLLMEG